MSDTPRIAPSAIDKLDDAVDAVKRELAAARAEIEKLREYAERLEHLMRHLTGRTLREIDAAIDAVRKP